MSKHDDQVFQVPAQFHRWRLDLALVGLLKDYSRSSLNTWIKEGKIKHNHQLASPKDKVLENDTISITWDAIKIEDPLLITPQPMNLAIVYEDEALLVVNKPAGLIVHPGAGNPSGTLINALSYYNPALAALPRAGIIHRLDKDTTGLLIVAKTIESYTDLVRKMQSRSITRRYLALVHGQVSGKGEIDTCFGRHPHLRTRMAVTKTGKQAQTLFSLKAAHPDFSLLTVELLTGRTHQIRVHMAFIQHPVVGDPVYGRTMRIPTHLSPEGIAYVKAFQRQALHAAAVTFVHPFTDKILTLEADLPEDFATLIHFLGMSS